MTLFTGSGSIPVHQYVWVAREFVRTDNNTGWEPAIWFGLQSTPSRAFGLHVRLDNGAIVRNLPPHSIKWVSGEDERAASWILQDAQIWDCTGEQFSIHEYKYLREMSCVVRDTLDRNVEGTYLFTVVPMDDGWSREPEQQKEYLFIRTEGGRLAIRPTNMVLTLDDSQRRMDVVKWPDNIKSQAKKWHAEG
jgi:hypothetical protein